MGKFLVTIDFSKSSECASKMTAKIAQKSGSIIYFLKIVELPSGISNMGWRSEFIIPESMLYLRKI